MSILSLFQIVKDVKIVFTQKLIDEKFFQNPFCVPIGVEFQKIPLQSPFHFARARMPDLPHVPYDHFVHNREC